MLENTYAFVLVRNGRNIVLRNSQIQLVGRLSAEAKWFV